MNRRQRVFSRLLQLTISLVSTSATTLYADVTWDQQAERLQLVSASMLDAQPLMSPAGDGGERGQFRIAGKTIVSVLPKMNATVGGKSEQPPQPPAHAVPTLEGSYTTARSGVGQGLIRIWSGYLPKAAAKQTGMKASAEQSIFGLSLGVQLPESAILNSDVEVGQQWNNTTVEGGITEIDAQDRFLVKTKLRFVALTVKPKYFDRIWIQGQVSERQVSTHFEIPSDGTAFDLTDMSSVASGNAATQLTVGYEIAKGLQGAVGYLNVPQRVSMPRFLMSYSVTTAPKQRGEL